MGVEAPSRSFPIISFKRAPEEPIHSFNLRGEWYRESLSQIMSDHVSSRQVRSTQVKSRCVGSVGPMKVELTRREGGEVPRLLNGSGAQGEGAGQALLGLLLNETKLNWVLLELAKDEAGEHVQ